MPVSRSPTAADPAKGKAIRGRGGANVSASPGNQSKTGTGSNPGGNKPKKSATDSARGAARSAARPTRNNPGDEPLAEGLPDTGERGTMASGPTESEAAAISQPENPPLLEEVRRLTNLLPGTPVANTGRVQGGGATAQANDPVTPTNPGTEGQVVTPRHRQKEKVATDLVAAKKLFKVVNDFEVTVETQVTERKYDNLDELHAKQYRLETENATSVLVNSSLATVRRFPAEAAELNKIYQNNVTVLEYTRRILRDATHQLGQATGDQRPIEERSQPGSPVNRQAPRQDTLPDIGQDGIDPLLRGEIPDHLRREQVQNTNTDMATMVVDLGTPIRTQGVGRNQGTNPDTPNRPEPGTRPDARRSNRPNYGDSPPFRSQSQRREPERPEQPPRSRESPDKFNFYTGSGNTTGNPRNQSNSRSARGSGGLAPNADEYMGSAAFYGALTRGLDPGP